MGAITEFDFKLLDAISELRCEALTVIMKVFSYLGSGGIIWIVTGLILTAIPKTRKIGIFSLVALAVEYTVGDLMIKPLIARERPFIQHPWIDTIIKHPGSYSFPSGHTSSSAAVSFMIFLHNKKAGIPMMIIAVLIMFSRLYFCVHFPTDILFGVIHGVLWTVIVYILLNKIIEKKNRTSQ